MTNPYFLTMFWNLFALKLPCLPLEKLRLSLSIDLLLATPPSPLLSNTTNFSSFLPTYWPLYWTLTLRYIFFGNFNINVLKYTSCEQAREFIDLLFSFGLLQTVTKPTK